MSNDYITGIEQENAKLRSIVDKLEDENSVCVMWKPRWEYNGVNGYELILGKNLVIGSVCPSPVSECWWSYVSDKIMSTDSINEKEAKRAVIDAIINGEDTPLDK